ncbi:SpoIIE family protein phosphatase [Streptomyces sp. NBC_00038]|uniref:SpoIIE family protein phosphatase n=1 Tax=Streptomyces sp. NBC_00038 TaxID=2903615 RepID=UPI00224F10DF|nr:SpoIIE family protein phosphatase [Streptomyces sp. NBC_00038]MCX5563501.1 SpoIIE family protein phosphatase [Streptomyces sp. NBC_00038]
MVGIVCLCGRKVRNAMDGSGQEIGSLTGARVDTSVAIAVTDRDGRVTYWSSGAESLLGYTPAEIIGRSVADLVTADGATLHRDGRHLDTRVHLSPLLDTDREAAYLVTVYPGQLSGASPDSSLMRWMFEQHPAPLVVYDRDARVLHGNAMMLRTIGTSEGEARGRRPTELVDDSVSEDVERRILRVARTGEPEFTEPFVRLPGEPKPHAWAVDIFPLNDAAGRIRAVGWAASDYSQQYASRERLALVSEARTCIGSSLDVVTTARELAEVAVPRFADHVSVDLVESVFGGELPAPTIPLNPIVLRRAAHRSVSSWPPETEPSPGKAHSHGPSSPVAQCLANGSAVLHYVKDVEIAPWPADEHFPAALAESLGTHSLIAVPIRARSTILGAVLFIRTATSREPFGLDDLAITEDLVARAAVCLDNARRFTRERGIALALQRNLLPQGPIVHPAVDTAARYLPAGGGSQAAGDWFDVIPLPGARVGLAVGDVVGHGINASATMGRLRTAVRTLADIDLPPDELLTHLDDIVTHAADDQDPDATGEIPGDVGATCLYAVYDPVSSTCSMATAGHPAPVLLSRDGASSVIDLPVGPPLGLGKLPFEATELTLPDGSLLALFTDGLLETRVHDIDEGLRDLCHALEQPATSLDALADDILETLSPKNRGDDITLLLARTRVLDRHHVVFWDLPSDPATVAETRKRVHDQLAVWSLEEEAFTTELVVSELVTNAMRYGQPPIQLRLIRDNNLICEVSDSSSTAPHLRRARVFDEGGRGLFLVAQLTERWGTRYNRTGKTIWAEQAIPVVTTDQAA